MSERLDLARATAAALRSRAGDVPALRVIAGLDGAVDSIIRVVDRRDSRESFTPMRSMRQFAERVESQVGRSINVEFVVERVKIGGNGVLFANPFTLWGARVAYIGALLADADAPVAKGSDAARMTHPVFDEFVARCERAHPIAAPALSDACEFADGKVIIGKTAAQDAVSWRGVLDAVGGVEGAVDLFAGAGLFAPMNWTMLSEMTDIWRRVTRDVLPRIDEARRPRVFIDLADPAKRSEGDLCDALGALGEMNEVAPVTLGCNFSESTRIGRAIGAALPDGDDLGARAETLRGALGLSEVCIHTRQRAGAAAEGERAVFDAAFTNEPAISTGAGDTFNAGYALGAALGLPVAQRLALAIANSGFYVRERTPPTLEQLASFLDDLPAPEAAS
ncbi:MAG: hypothetical protein ACTS27_08795 [Phycisphaerales bacterium]